MARDLNRVIVSGRVTQEPELRRTQGGLAVLNIGIAVNDSKKNNQTGEWEDIVGFYDCVMFGNRAESLSGIITKGMPLTIEGKLRYRKWESDGKTKSKVEIIAESVLLPPRPQGEYQRPAQAPQQAPQAAEPQQSFYADEDIPF